MKYIEDRGTSVGRSYGLYECPRCYCHFVSRKDTIKSGQVKSCGCSKEKHGLTGTKIYGVYKAMKSRCYSKTNRVYTAYGGQGVTICKEWLSSPKAFAEWADANGYEEGLELDKDELCELKQIKPSLYSPETCQWITKRANRAIQTAQKRKKMKHAAV